MTSASKWTPFSMKGTGPVTGGPNSSCPSLSWYSWLATCWQLRLRRSTMRDGPSREVSAATTPSRCENQAAVYTCEQAQWDTGSVIICRLKLVGLTSTKSVANMNMRESNRCVELYLRLTSCTHLTSQLGYIQNPKEGCTFMTSVSAYLSTTSPGNPSLSPLIQRCPLVV
eukprot:1183951-Prorocentrum_minimum.AAC.4